MTLCYLLDIYRHLLLCYNVGGIFMATNHFNDLLLQTLKEMGLRLDRVEGRLERVEDRLDRVIE